MNELFIGVMSGTSMDGIDAVLVNFSASSLQLLAAYHEPMPPALKNELSAITQTGHDEINRMGQLDRQVGMLFAQTCKKLLEQAQIPPAAIHAIGSHGQTVRHQPGLAHPFTLQIGDPTIIAHSTGITTVADFRRRDMAAGGQGAPLVPAFHAHALRSKTHSRIVLNIGGIANITYLPAAREEPVIGFDTGPANTLLDAWIKEHLQQEFDPAGQWAASGKLHEALLARMLSDAYFHSAPPKSTGREYFNLTWLQNYLKDYQLPPQDVQRTLLELTARSIVLAIQQFCPDTSEILICGGGIKNDYLLQRLALLAQPLYVGSTQEYGIHPQWMEAIAFAWLARQTLMRQPGNLPSVTGAKSAVVLGGIYPA